MKCQILFSGEKISPICRLETICMKYLILLSGKYKKNVTNLSSAELVERVVKVNKASVWFCRLHAVVCTCLSRYGTFHTVLL